MKRERVNSSNLKSVGYDPTVQVLEIEFHDGSVYQYTGVPQTIHSELMRASSHGSYFHKNVREKYPYRKIV